MHESDEDRHDTLWPESGTPLRSIDTGLCPLPGRFSEACSRAAEGRRSYALPSRPHAEKVTDERVFAHPSQRFWRVQREDAPQFADPIRPLVEVISSSVRHLIKRISDRRAAARYEGVIAELPPHLRHDIGELDCSTPTAPPWQIQHSYQELLEARWLRSS